MAKILIVTVIEVNEDGIQQAPVLISFRSKQTECVFFWHHEACQNVQSAQQGWDMVWGRQPWLTKNAVLYNIYFLGVRHRGSQVELCAVNAISTLCTAFWSQQLLTNSKSLASQKYLGNPEPPEPCTRDYDQMHTISMQSKVKIFRRLVNLSFSPLNQSTPGSVFLLVLFDGLPQWSPSPGWSCHFTSSAFSILQVFCVTQDAIPVISSVPIQKTDAYRWTNHVMDG